MSGLTQARRAREGLHPYASSPQRPLLRIEQCVVRFTLLPAAVEIGIDVLQADEDARHASLASHFRRIDRRHRRRGSHAGGAYHYATWSGMSGDNHDQRELHRAQSDEAGNAPRRTRGHRPRNAAAHPLPEGDHHGVSMIRRAGLLHEARSSPAPGARPRRKPCIPTLLLCVLLPQCIGSDLRAKSSSGPVPWQRALDQEPGWYASAEAIRIADNVLLHQHDNGGWLKNIDKAAVPGGADKSRLLKEKAEGSTTIDNGATRTEMRYLARVYEATRQERFRHGFLRGLDFLLEAQYENGGWPQFFPLREGYYSRITYNDNAMVNALTVLRDAAAGKPPYGFVDQVRRARARAAVARGIDVILRTQVRQNGKLTAWCAQHDERTLEPAWARNYEPPSLSGNETAGIVRFLMAIEQQTPAIISAVEGAVAWLEAVAIRGLRVEEFTDAEGRPDRRVVADPAAGPLWARFYELGTNRPIFMGRDKVIRYKFEEIERERRAGYAYYGPWPATLLAKEYPRWRAALLNRRARQSSVRSPEPSARASRRRHGFDVRSGFRCDRTRLASPQRRQVDEVGSHTESEGPRGDELGHGLQGNTTGGNELDLGERSLDRSQIGRSSDGVRGKDLYRVGSGLPGGDDLRRCQCTGKDGDVQNPAGLDGVEVERGTDDEPGSRVHAGTRGIGVENGAGADERFVADPSCQIGDDLHCAGDG